MNNTELMAEITVNTGVAANLSHDNIEALLKNGDQLTRQEVERLAEIKERLQRANAAIVHLELNARQVAAGAKDGKGFWQAEQFGLFERPRPFAPNTPDLVNAS